MYPGEKVLQGLITLTFCQWLFCSYSIKTIAGGGGLEIMRQWKLGLTYSYIILKCKRFKISVYLVSTVVFIIKN
jgi:hypothetical protein